METILIPVDFSENSLDAVAYGFNFSKELSLRRIILYHSCYGKEDGEDLEQELKNVGSKFSQHENLEVLYIVDNFPLVNGVLLLRKKYLASLIIMGITGRNKLGQKLIGSSVFEIIEHVDVPVLVIPAKSRYEKISNISLALPMISGLKKHIPFDSIINFVNTLVAQLMIVNVAKRNDRTPKSVLYSALKEMFEVFDELNPSYHFLTAQFTAEMITEFVTNNNVQLLITIPGEYGALDTLFRTSVTKKLAYQSSIPLLIFKQPGSSDI